MDHNKIKVEIRRRYHGGSKHKEAMIDTFTDMRIWEAGLETFEHEESLLFVIPTTMLPITNMCNYCHLKGSDCYEKESPTCYGSSRPDGIDVIFAKKG